MSVVDPLSGCDPDVDKVEIKPGKFVWIKALDGAGRAAYRKLALSAEGSMDAHDIAALGIIKSESDHALAYVSEDQISILKSKDGAVLQKIALKLLSISGLGSSSREDEEKKS